MDMATGVWSYASPEFMLASSALADLSKYYRLPIFSFAGCSDSKVFDQQASLESALWILMTSLFRGNLVHDVGYIESGLTTSFEQLVISNETIGLVRRITQGFAINEETLALDLIDEVGPGGEFLTSAHTLKHFKENWFPNLISRKPYENWVKDGRKDLGIRAKEKIKSILKTHEPRPLSEALQSELKKIIKSMNR
jgi:trimethylamine--corrinoid protein Co-methyltransferase